jgi:uncharacterized membrane protein
MSWTGIFDINGKWEIVSVVAVIIVIIILLTICYNMCCKHNTYTSQNDFSEVTRIESRRPRARSIDSGDHHLMNIELIHSSIKKQSTLSM